MILVSKYLTAFFSLGKANGITLFPFIFLSDEYSKQNVRLVNHEKIHYRQAIELLVVPFYVIYLIEFVYKIVRMKNFHLAYINVSFEREAYANDANLNYLQQRKCFQFIHYF